MEEKKTVTIKEEDKINEITKDIELLTTALKELKINDFYVFGQDQESTELELDKLKSKVVEAVSKSKNFCSDCKEYYNKIQHFVPTDISQEVGVGDMFVDALSPFNRKNNIVNF